MKAMEQQQNEKSAIIQKETRLITKREKEAKKLEILEAEVLKRLRDTHIKQQQVISEIQSIFKPS